MATTLKVLLNYVDAAVTYAVTPADYIEMDLTNDYLVWTTGDATVKDLMTAEPTAAQLNAAATIISDSADTTVPLCLLMDYSHDVGGSYYTHKVIGMSENKRYVYGFNFSAATATEPQLEAWDTTGHTTNNKHVLGAGMAANSMLKGVCTTSAPLGAGWAGAALANSTNVLLLNAGKGALGATGTLYANLKIVIPTAYATPAAETFVLTVRYCWA